jgi:uncharacterized protein YyaL (SSP411 family)
MTMETQNRLSTETSPYLLQHATNPVAWYGWGPEALALARRENKPILLSIGYAACHWCHVMAHESFEDQATADIMNKFFVNIKVDREERPDLDKIYQTTHYYLTEHGGGWPLTVFLSPDDLAPFFSGTYFPNQPRHKLPAFKDILFKIAEIFRDRLPDIRKQNESLKNILQKPTLASATEKHALDSAPLELAHQSMVGSYDARFGGFGDAPKFPNHVMLEFLLQESSDMALTTLYRMAEGGLYDQLQGGFYRYTVDREWQIPHFEKMLYDNAQLLALYATAAETFTEPYFAEVTRETANWVMTEMQSPAGGYYSTLDADSEGHEGKYYVWDLSEIEKILTREEFHIVKAYFGLDANPNFDKQWHLHIVEALRNNDEKKLLAAAKKKMLAVREKRVRPHRDEKILTGWNALMIKGMLIAGNILHEPTFIASARQALTFVRENLWRNGRLIASFKDGKASLQAYLDDYVFLLDAVLTATSISGDDEDLKFAKELAENIMKYFYDDSAGGFYFTALDHEKLLYRPKTLMDDAVPSANGVAVRCFIQLANLTKDKRYRQAAEKTLQLAWPLLLEHPAEHCALVLGLQAYLN